MRDFENRVLRRIFRSKRNQVTGDWRRLHDEELNSAYSSPNVFRVIKSRRMRKLGHVCFGGDLRKKSSLRCEDKITIVLQDVGWGGMD
jgi:hypothetical protein